MEVYSVRAHSTAELAELFNVARSTIYRTIHRQERARVRGHGQIRCHDSGSPHHEHDESRVRRGPYGPGVTERAARWQIAAASSYAQFRAIHFELRC